MGIHTDLAVPNIIQANRYCKEIVAFMWDLLSVFFFRNLSITRNRSLLRVMSTKETASDMLNKSSKQLLLRWFNFHLRHALRVVQKQKLGGPYPTRKIRSFAKDLKDGQCYLLVLKALASAASAGRSKHTDNHHSLKKVDELLQQYSSATNQGLALQQRAQFVLTAARMLGRDTVFGKFLSVLRVRDLLSGDSQLHLAFISCIFQLRPGLERTRKQSRKSIQRQDVQQLMDVLVDTDKTNSSMERVFRLWINSMGLKHQHIVQNLFASCIDGLLLLRVIDHIEKGLVDWKKVCRKPKNKFQKILNCNRVVKLGKSLKFSLVGIGGMDVHSCNKKLTLSLVWQLMRYHSYTLLKRLRAKRFGKNINVTDTMITKWANQTVRSGWKSIPTTVKTHPALHALRVANKWMGNFKDVQLANSIYFFNLLDAIQPSVIDWDIVTKGSNKQQKILNARYAISAARKLGAVLFLLPEDIVEVKHKMISLFVCCILSTK